MSFIDELNRHSKDIATVFDLAAFCYDYLVKVVGNQAYFLGKYIFEGRDEAKRNPNIDALLEMSDSAVMILKKIWQGIAFAECLAELQILAQKTVSGLVDYGDKTRNCATVPFWLMKGIDRYICEIDDEHWKMHREEEPLNSTNYSNSYIYVRRGRMMIEDAAEELDFPPSIVRASIKEQFEYLIILDKAQLHEDMSAPRIVELLIDERDKQREGIVQGKTLKLAVIPFSEDKMLDFPTDQGGCFRVEYINIATIMSKIAKT